MNRTAHPAARGFSLVEVLVALIIVSVGLLGIAKMQALMLSNTGIARLRALVALEVSSLADSMHADHDYWYTVVSGFASPLQITINPAAATAVTVSGDSNLASSVATAIGNTTLCETGSAAVPCTATNMAGYDLAQWEQAMYNVVPNATTTISCATTSNVVTCTLTVNWTENTVNANTQEQGNTAFQNQSYQLVVEP